MRDAFGREIDYLRISVTDRCNLQCDYCVPVEGIDHLPHEAVLSFEEIAEVARLAVGMGVRKIRLTGGEPLVRRRVEKLVEMIAGIAGVEDLAVTTNGILLAGSAKTLRDAGLMRVNVSLDTLDPERFRTLTRGGDLEQVLRGIDAALDAGLAPVKINCVVAESSDEEDARRVTNFAREKGLEIRFIKKMKLASGMFSVVEGGAGGDCPSCNRLRLLCDGNIRPCLFSNLQFNVRELGAERALREALRQKPKSGTLCSDDSLHAIGG